MKILVIGSGGREHSIVWKISQSPHVKEIYIAPGNGGTADIAENIDISVNDVVGLKQFAKDKGIDYTIVGPEVPLVSGLVDEFEKEGMKIFGPSSRAAIIEGSKAFSKKFMSKYEIPTADYVIINNPSAAEDIIKKGRFKYPYVIKADGLAAGKGSIIVKNKKEAKAAIERLMVNKEFGVAGETIIFEEFLEGDETSFMVFSDGKRGFPMVTSKDFKRLENNNEGPNTGGMGAISPSPYMDYDFIKDVYEKIIMPTIYGMSLESRLFKGVLYAGLMLTKEGPKVLEYNCRFGDPETQAMLMRLNTDLIEIIDGVVNNTIKDMSIEWGLEPSGCVVLASGGYPEQYEKGKEIVGLKRAKMIKGVQIFHAGTKKEGNKVYTNGGRVLNVCASATSLKKAMEKIYNAISFISFENMAFRTDIGVEKEK
jgi:phosphoribosylamine--glycine ligase